MQQPWKAFKIASALSLVAAIGAACIAVFIPPALRQQRAGFINTYNVIDSPDAPSYPGWRDSASSSIARTLKVYLFNVTNPDDIVNGDAPVLQEVGPFSFNVRSIKHEINWQLNTDVVAYKEWQTYTLASDSLSLDTAVNAIYSPYVFAQANGFGELMSEKSLKQLFRKYTAQELLFGYSDEGYSEMMTLLPPNALRSSVFPGILTNISSMAENSIVTGFNRIYSGSITRYRAHSYLSYNGMDALYCCLDGPCGDTGPTGYDSRPAWGSPAANDVDGSTSEFVRAGVAAGDTLRVFSPLMLRTYPIVNVNGASAQYADLNALRFTIDMSSMQAAGTNPSNSDYYAFGYDGIYNMSNCGSAQPLFVSKPYFLDVANASVADAIVGLPQPNRLLHDTFYDIEPMSGAVVGIHERMQVNAYISPNLSPAGGHVSSPSENTATATDTLPQPPPAFPNVRSLYLPVYWFDRGAAISDDEAQYIYQSVYETSRNATITEAVGAAFGAAFFITAAVLFMHHNKLRRKAQYEQREAAIAAVMLSASVAQETTKALLLRQADRDDDDEDSAWGSQASRSISEGDLDARNVVTARREAPRVDAAHNNSPSWLDRATDWLFSVWPSSRDGDGIPLYEPSASFVSQLSLQTSEHEASTASDV